ncbi:Lar family restriction alleviation protein [Pseudomonas sp. PH1b]|uniref:Lar family restriction alleviation protein n=1 Tax=Pseudomonas sp. PH1b TaxID=1397282 RepID=UPI000468A4B6|nr:Lar family restriction alleviation protein [Pseudomonas sp. PH1b]
MTEQIKLAPCPFCEGPPCIDAFDFITGELLAEDRPQSEDLDEYYSAHVWCHDCGARGPDINSCTLGTFEHQFGLTVMQLMRIAAERWNDRHANARSAYDLSEAAGRNLFPGNDDVESGPCN